MLTISDLIQVVFVIILVTLLGGIIGTSLIDMFKAKRKRGKKK